MWMNPGITRTRNSRTFRDGIFLSLELPLADLIAAPSKIDVLSANNRPIPQSGYSQFTQKMIGAIRDKYNPYGRSFLA